MFYFCLVIEPHVLTSMGGTIPMLFYFYFIIWRKKIRFFLFLHGLTIQYFWTKRFNIQLDIMQTKISLYLCRSLKTPKYVLVHQRVDRDCINTQQNHALHIGVSVRIWWIYAYLMYIIYLYLVYFYSYTDPHTGLGINIGVSMYCVQYCLFRCICLIIHTLTRCIVHAVSVHVCKYMYVSVCVFIQTLTRL